MDKLDPAAKFLVTGATLNAINEAIATNKPLPGFGIESRTEPGKGTHFWVDLSAVGESQPWDIVVVESAWGIEVGTILKNTGKYNDTLPCSNPAATWSLAAGDILAVKINGVTPSAYSLERYTSWPIAGSYFVAVGSGAFSYRVYPLWSIQSTDANGATRLADELYAKRLAPPAHLRLIDCWHRTSGGSVIDSIDLIAYSGAP